MLSPDVAAALAGAAAKAPHDALSPREFQVLLGLVEGLPVDAIARRLRLSAKTVANYQTAVRQRLGIETPLQLLQYAQRHRLVAA